MFRREYIVRAVSPWLLSSCFLAAGIVALVAAPPPFVQHLSAQTGGCVPDNPASCTGTQVCCGGVCQDCCQDSDCPSGEYCCGGACQD